MKLATIFAIVALVIIIVLIVAIIVLAVLIPFLMQDETTSSSSETSSSSLETSSSEPPILESIACTSGDIRFRTYKKQGLSYDAVDYVIGQDASELLGTGVFAGPDPNNNQPFYTYCTTNSSTLIPIYCHQFSTPDALICNTLTSMSGEDFAAEQLQYILPQATTSSCKRFSPATVSFVSGINNFTLSVPFDVSINSSGWIDAVGSQWVVDASQIIGYSPYDMDCLA